MPKKKYTKELLGEAVASSLSMREALQKCGVPNLTGSFHYYISRLVREFGIDTSHFLGQRRNLGTKAPNRKEAGEVLVFHGNRQRQRSKALVKALLDRGREYKCFVCGLKEWRKKKIVLEVEHKDGDFQNDREDNLEFICPNCHSQTETYCRGTRTPKPQKERKRKFQSPSDLGYWRTRPKPDTRKTERPSLGELQSLAQTMPMTKIGKKFGVSDNAVRKWFKWYGVEVPKRSRQAQMA